MAKYEIKDGEGIIPKGVTEIENDAFRGCTDLTSIEIPVGVTKIGDSAFYGCTGLTSIKVAEGNKAYDSRNNCNAIIERKTNTLISGCKSTVIPDSVTEIGGVAFSGCTGLTSIVIPKGVTKIGREAFYGCTGLKEVTLPVGVKKIYEYAFAGCDALETIYVPAKKADYYKKRLPEGLHSLIVELEPENKAKKK